MSPADDIPPVGEQIHLPEPSLLPLACAVGLTLTVVGTTVSVFLLVPGLIVLLYSVARWIGDVRRDVAALPEEHRAPRP